MSLLYINPENEGKEQRENFAVFLLYAPDASLFYYFGCVPDGDARHSRKLIGWGVRLRGRRSAVRIANGTSVSNHFHQSCHYQRLQCSETRIAPTCVPQ
jgi:hypothetical protein